MTRVALPLSLFGLVLAPVFGCDQNDVPDQGDAATDTGTDTSDTDTDTDTTDTETGGDTEADVIYVDIDAPPGGDGSSWATARNDLRATVEELANVGGTVWVAEGTYTPPDAGVVLRVGPGVNLYGGFAGVEALLSERDHLAHPTILQQTHAEAPVVEIDDFTVQTPPIVLDGFVVTGDPNTPTEERGHGISVLGNVNDQSPQPQISLHNIEIHGTSGALWIPGWSTVEIHAASIHDNAGSGGPAIYQGQSRVLVHDSKIFANEASGSGVIEHFKDWDLSYFGYIELWNSEISDNGGGGINGASVVLHDCLLQANTGGRAARASLGLTAEDTDFIGNLAGAATGAHGAIRRSRFIDNNGGALYTYGSFTVDDSLFQNNFGGSGGAISGWVIEFEGAADISVRNSKFIGNSAAQGGAIFSYSDWWVGSATIDVINSQFVGNEADDGGAIYGPVRVEASSFADNIALSGAALAGPSSEEADFPGELHACVLWPDDVSVNVTHSISNSCIPAGLQGFADLGGNAGLLEDPFERADLDDDGIEELYLDPGSACVNLGGEVSGLDWSVMTTQASQCTDSGLLDAGVHHTPLEDVGVCG